ncbi:uncharacterized protein LOC143369796 [Andrena cerasifolii]|uniref:uncharacterized protein LOC143369796 n=1 Tax=Andrena cerasifolii TaxID=2819439 RepID=UPI0040376F9A
MKNAGIIDEKDSQLYDLNESSLSGTGNKISQTFIYGKSLTTPILGSFVPVSDVPKKYVEPTVLDTSLSHIPTYTHLKMYDLKSVARPKTPPVLLALRSKFLNGTESRLSSKTSLLTEQTSARMNSIPTNWRESEKVLKTE